MQNQSKGDYAYTMLDISDTADEAAVRKITAIEGVVRIRVI